MSQAFFPVTDVEVNALHVFLGPADETTVAILHASLAMALIDRAIE